MFNSENIPTPYAYKRLMGCDRKFNVAGDINYWHNTTILIRAYEKYKDGTLDSDSYQGIKADISKQITETRGV